MDMKNAKRIVLNSFLGLSIALVLMAAAWAVFSNTEDTFLFGYKPYFIASESMEPAFKKHAIVLIKKDSYHNVRTGEVIAFKASQASGKAALHRVVGITANGFVTKGDANKRVDEQIVTGEAFLGREVWHSNMTASLSRSVQTPQGLLIAVMLPCMLAALLVFLAKTIRRLSRQ